MSVEINSEDGREDDDDRMNEATDATGEEDERKEEEDDDDDNGDCVLNTAGISLNGLVVAIGGEGSEDAENDDNCKRWRSADDGNDDKEGGDDEDNVDLDANGATNWPDEWLNREKDAMAES